jgi:hypothetical protein
MAQNWAAWAKSWGTSWARSWGLIEEPDTGRKTGGIPMRGLVDAEAFALHSKHTTRVNAITAGVFDEIIGMPLRTTAVGARCQSKGGVAAYGISSCTAKGRRSRTAARHPDCRGAHHLRIDGGLSETAAGVPDVKNVSRGYPVGGFNVSDAHFIEGRGTTTKAERQIVVVVRPRVGV